MKRKSIIPKLFITVGLSFIGIGAFRMADSKSEAAHSLQQAKIVTTLPPKAHIKDSPQSFKPNLSQTIGLLNIPKIHSELAIVEGTDSDELKKGVGHYKGSFLPGQSGQIVLSGHRDTVFRHLGELKLSDTLEVRMPYGTFVYKIIATKIVDQSDTSIITLQHEKEELILTTCYPFYFIGNAPKRYIIYAQTLAQK